MHTSQNSKQFGEDGLLSDELAEAPHERHALLFACRSTLGAGQISLLDGPLTDDTQKHTYVELGRLEKLEIVDDSMHSTATYSEEYTLTAVQNNLGTSNYSYSDQSGRPTTVGYPNGMQILYDYYSATDDLLLKQIENMSSGAAPTVISQFDYTYRQGDVE